MVMKVVHDLHYKKKSINDTLFLYSFFGNPNVPYCPADHPNGLSSNGLVKGVSLPFPPPPVGIIMGLIGGLSIIRFIDLSSSTRISCGFMYGLFFDT